MPNDIIGILLAAGQSKRMGEAKQLLDIHGEPLIVHTAKKLLAIADNFKLITVLGARAAQIEPTLQNTNTEVIINKNYQKGMGTSLTAALQYIDNQLLTPDALLLSVCDQPYLTTALLQKLIEKHRQFPTQIITAAYGENFGVPAIIPRPFFAELRKLKADTGAKKVMRNHREQLVFVDFPRGEIDLDTPADYQQFIG